MATESTVSRRTLIDVLIFVVTALVCFGEGYRLHVTANPNILAQRLAPGLYVFILGAALMVAALLHLAGNLRNDESLSSAPMSRRARLHLAGIVATLVGYAVLISVAGYLVATIAFFLVVFQIFAIRPWYLSVGLSVALAAVFHVIFVQYLDIIFPRGAFF
jgi:hypothetical protein